MHDMFKSNILNSNLDCNGYQLSQVKYYFLLRLQYLFIDKHVIH